MIRDFTQAKLESLSDEINNIKKKDWSKFTDTIGDWFTNAGECLGLVSIKEDMSNIDSYQRKVLDMTDMTKGQLEDIFEKVYSVDKTYQSKFNDIHSRMDTFNKKIAFLSGAIQPNFTIKSAASIRDGCAQYNSTMKEYGATISKAYQEDIKWSQNNALKKSGKGFLKSLVSGVVDVVCLPANMIKNVYTGNYVAIVSDTWSVINDVFAVGSNAVAFTSALFAYIPMGDGAKHYALQYAEAFAGASGLTDALKADEAINGEGGLVTWMRTGSEFIDTLDSTVGVINDVKDYAKADKWSDFLSPGGFKANELSDWDNKDLLKKYRKINSKNGKLTKLYHRIGDWSHYSTFKRVGKVYGYVDACWDTDEGFSINHAGKKIVEGVVKPIKSWGDASDLGEDLAELLFGEG